MALAEPLRARLAALVADNPVVLFMKGTRGMPQCGFSAQVVRILDDLVPAYETVDVLASPELRDGIKEFSQWPTIPQLYVGGQFVGGCDIVRDLQASGELAKLIGGLPAGEAPAAPKITVTEAAALAFQAALADAGGDLLHFQVGPGFQHELFFAPREPGDLEVTSGGLTLLVDRASARHADGVVIDYVGGASDGFKITNPHEPARVKSLSVGDLKALLDKGEALELFDVRTPDEIATAKLDRARPLDDAGEAHLAALDRATPIAFLCHHGMRSRAAGERALQRGFKTVYNIEGGIDAWSRAVDPTVPRY